MKTEVKMGLGVGAALLAVIVAAVIVSKEKTPVQANGGSPTEGHSSIKPDSSSSASTDTPAVTPSMLPGTPSTITPTTTPSTITPSSIEIGQAPSGTPAMTTPATRSVASTESPTTLPSSGLGSATPTNPPLTITPSPSGTPSGERVDWNALLAGASTSNGSGSPANHSGTGSLPPSVGPRNGTTPGAGLTHALGNSSTGSAAGTYTIKSGDTLSSISTSLYGSPNYWSKIVQANPGLNPNRLKAGAVIKLPSEVDVKASASAPPKEEKVGGSSTVADPTRQYQVQAGDSLVKIAQRLYGNGNRWEEIYNANKGTLASPTKLKIGMILKLPAPPKTPATKG